MKLTTLECKLLRNFLEHLAMDRYWITIEEFIKASAADSPLKEVLERLWKEGG